MHVCGIRSAFRVLGCAFPRAAQVGTHNIVRHLTQAGISIVAIGAFVFSSLLFPQTHTHTHTWRFARIVVVAQLNSFALVFVRIKRFAKSCIRRKYTNTCLRI